MKRIAMTLATSLLAGCAAPPTNRTVHPPEAIPHAENVRDTAVEPTGTLNLESALAAALMRNPELTAYSYRVRAGEARMQQARLLPNPELGVEIDEYDRGGNGFDSAETAVSLGQLFELGGKRGKRMRMAEAAGELAGWDYETKRLDVLAETTRRFIEVLAAQERVGLADSSVELANETSVAVAERVKAGKEPPFQAAKSDAELEMARMEAQTARNRLEVARKRLAAMWGTEQTAFDRVQGRLDRVPETVPSLDALRGRLKGNPDLARWETELRLREAALASEKAARVPDMQASVGFRQFEEDGTDALMFGIGLPLPLFDRNQGNIAAASHELFRAEAERSATELALATELGGIHAALVSAHQRTTALRDKVVPAMDQAYEAVHTGYRQGKFGILDMLDAQRNLFNAQAALVDALTDYQLALTDLQRATGSRVDEPMD